MLLVAPLMEHGELLELFSPTFQIFGTVVPKKIFLNCFNDFWHRNHIVFFPLRDPLYVLLSSFFISVKDF